LGFTFDWTFLACVAGVNGEGEGEGEGGARTQEDGDWGLGTKPRTPFSSRVLAPLPLSR